MRMASAGKLRFVKPKSVARASTQTSLTENVVTRIRNQTTSGRTVRVFVTVQ
jgi:hypothetical protein